MKELVHGWLLKINHTKHYYLLIQTPTMDPAQFVNHQNIFFNVGPNNPLANDPLVYQDSLSDQSIQDDPNPINLFLNVVQEIYLNVQINGNVQLPAIQPPATEHIYVPVFFPIPIPILPIQPVAILEPEIVVVPPRISGMFVPPKILKPGGTMLHTYPDGSIAITARGAKKPILKAAVKVVKKLVSSAAEAQKPSTDNLPSDYFTIEIISDRVTEYIIQHKVVIITGLIILVVIMSVIVYNKYVKHRIITWIPKNYWLVKYIRYHNLFSLQKIDAIMLLHGLIIGQWLVLIAVFLVQRVLWLYLNNNLPKLPPRSLNSEQIKIRNQFELLSNSVYLRILAQTLILYLKNRPTP